MNWPYIAGFFDGEGSVGVYHNGSKNSTMVRVGISQSGDIGKKTLEEIRDFLSGHGIRSYVGSDKLRSTVRQQQHGLDITNRSGVVVFLRGVFPYLRIKKVKAQDVIRWCILFPAMTMSQRSGQRTTRKGRYSDYKGDCCGQRHQNS